jgi:hypothetical protein
VRVYLAAVLPGLSHLRRSELAALTPARWAEARG